MSSDYKDKRPHKGFFRSFRYAFEGIIHAFKKERNLKIHVGLSILIITLGFVYSISLHEWLFVMGAIGGMISLELINTAIERVVDLVTDKHHPLAKQAKDVSAGAVLVFAFISAIIGLVIFIPKIF